MSSSSPGPTIPASSASLMVEAILVWEVGGGGGGVYVRGEHLIQTLYLKGAFIRYIQSVYLRMVFIRSFTVLIYRDFVVYLWHSLHRK